MISDRPLACLLVAASCAAGTSAAAEDRALPPAAAAILDQAEQIELLALDPYRTGDKPQGEFHDWNVAGRTVVKDDAGRRTLRAAIDAGIADVVDSVGEGFRPRHGIRAVHAGRTVELVICFERCQTQIFVDGKREPASPTSRAPSSALDRILRDGGVTPAGQATALLEARVVELGKQVEQLRRELEKLMPRNPTFPNPEPIKPTTPRTAK